MIRTFKKSWVELLHLVRFFCRAQYVSTIQCHQDEKREFRFDRITKQYTVAKWKIMSIYHVKIWLILFKHVLSPLIAYLGPKIAFFTIFRQNFTDDLKLPHTLEDSQDNSLWTKETKFCEKHPCTVLVWLLFSIFHFNATYGQKVGKSFPPPLNKTIFTKSVNLLWFMK